MKPTHTDLNEMKEKIVFFSNLQNSNCSSFYWLRSCLLRESGAKTAEVLDRSRNIRCFKRLVPKRLGSTKFEHGPMAESQKTGEKHGKIGGKGASDVFWLNDPFLLCISIICTYL